MAELKRELDGDLGKKLDRLRWTLEQPLPFISEYFAAIRNEIDLDAEQLIQHFQFMKSDKSTGKINKINVSRNKLLVILENMETSLFEKLQATPANSTDALLKVLDNRVDVFIALAEPKDLNEMEGAYVELALDIIDATNEAEKRLLDNQTVAYLLCYEGNEIGNLIYLSDDYLNRDELKCLKSHFNLESFSTRQVHEAIQASMNSSLVVPAGCSFVLDRKKLVLVTMILFNLVHFPSGHILYLGEMPKEPFDFSGDSSFEGIPVKEIQVLEDLDYSSENSIEAVRVPDLRHRPVPAISAPNFKKKINFRQNRLRSFEIDDSLMRPLQVLVLSENQLETLNEAQLAKAENLEVLSLVNACLPGTRFSISFLNALNRLTKLELTLPDASVDFEVFKNLVEIRSLKLYSATSQDSNVERPVLMKKHFMQLAAMSELTSLELSHFNIENLDPEMLTVFESKLNNICLTNCNIAHIDVNAFADATNSTRLSKCQHLDLSYNQIEKLAAGLFVPFSGLKYLYLDHNPIKCIESCGFLSMDQLLSLRLNHTLVESVEADAFDGLGALERLSLANSQLKSIDSRMLNGLAKLKCLILDFNQIELFRVSTKSREVIIEGILTPPEYEIVKKNLFGDLKRLTQLSLRGNSLKALDLNCFSNLSALKELDLGRNQISKLNDEIYFGVLSGLEKLDLSENQLTSVARHAFSESRQLKNLDLSGNKLERLAEDFFEPFEQLRHVNLNENNLSIEITERTFRTQIHCLAEINLANNLRVLIEDDAFKLMNQLEIIKIELHETNIKQLLKNEENNSLISSVKSLAILKSSIESLEIGKDTRFKNLTELDLRQNLIKVITRKDLALSPNLVRLELSGNVIETIDDPNVFRVLPKLQKLNLSGNKLKNIHRRIFKDLSRLKSLDLSNNPTLLNIDAGLFRGLFNLQELSMTGNNIATFDFASLFNSCRVLESLDFANNQLDNESVNETSMSGSTAHHLKQLVLANNRLERMNFVRGFFCLQKLDLRENNIKSLTSPPGTNILGQLVKLKHLIVS